MRGFIPIVPGTQVKNYFDRLSVLWIPRRLVFISIIDIFPTVMFPASSRPLVGLVGRYVKKLCHLSFRYSDLNFLRSNICPLEKKVGPCRIGKPAGESVRRGNATPLRKEMPRRAKALRMARPHGGDDGKAPYAGRQRL